LTVAQDKQLDSPDSGSCAPTAGLPNLHHPCRIKDYQPTRVLLCSVRSSSGCPASAAPIAAAWGLDTAAQHIAARHLNPTSFGRSFPPACRTGLPPACSNTFYRSRPRDPARLHAQGRRGTADSHCPISLRGFYVAGAIVEGLNQISFTATIWSRPTAPLLLPIRDRNSRRILRWALATSSQFRSGG
jgi:hypothetical protein